MRFVYATFQGGLIKKMQNCDINIKASKNLLYLKRNIKLAWSLPLVSIHIKYLICLYLTSNRKNQMFIKI